MDPVSRRAVLLTSTAAIAGAATQSYGAEHAGTQGNERRSREVTQRELPTATEIAGVNVRLKTGGVRELHWHRQAEWSIMLPGNARITAVDNDGKNFIADVQSGDLWYFPAGPHSIQGLDPTAANFRWHSPTGLFRKAVPFF